MIGNPKEEYVSTSYIERSNLTLRMANRRFTRLPNAFSKKLENHVHMIALYTVWSFLAQIAELLRRASIEAPRRHDAPRCRGPH